MKRRGKTHGDRLHQNEIDKNLSKARCRIAILSGKGGVGKTTVCTSLACALSFKGYNVGLIDADATGPGVLHMMGLDEPARLEGGKIVPATIHGVKIVSIAYVAYDVKPILWRSPMHTKLLHKFLRNVDWGTLDYLLADLPTGIGDDVLTIAQSLSLDFAIVVTMPQKASLLDSGRAVSFAKKLNIPNIGLIENMSGFHCPRCDANLELFGSGGGRKQANELQIEFLGSLPLDIDICLANDSRKPLMGGFESPAGTAISRIADCIEKSWGDRLIPEDRYK